VTYATLRNYLRRALRRGRKLEAQSTLSGTISLG
jgi:hypothetical protein